jgi:uncharacterized protein (UPF0548 family)
MPAFWSLRFPSHRRLQAFLATQTNLDFTYVYQGVTAGETVPAGYVRDHNRAQLGHGEQVFRSACESLHQWRQFPASWIRVFPENAPLTVGQTVVVLTRVFGVWRMNSARIVYLIDDAEPIRRYGFAYGTLPAHIERGEERFCIEFYPDGSVWYDLCAFSRPRLWLVWLVYPIARLLQRRFASQSKAAMIASINRS